MSYNWLNSIDREAAILDPRLVRGKISLLERLFNLTSSVSDLPIILNNNLLTIKPHLTDCSFAHSSMYLTIYANISFQLGFYLYSSLTIKKNTCFMISIILLSLCSMNLIMTFINKLTTWQQRGLNKLVIFRYKSWWIVIILITYLGECVF